MMHSECENERIALIASGCGISQQAAEMKFNRSKVSGEFAEAAVKRLKDARMGSRMRWHERKGRTSGKDRAAGG